MSTRDVGGVTKIFPAFPSTTFMLISVQDSYHVFGEDDCTYNFRIRPDAGLYSELPVFLRVLITESFADSASGKTAIN